MAIFPILLSVFYVFVMVWLIAYLAYYITRLATKNIEQSKVVWKLVWVILWLAMLFPTLMWAFLVGWLWASNMNRWSEWLSDDALQEYEDAAQKYQDELRMMDIMDSQQ